MSIVRFIEEGTSPAPFFVQVMEMKDGRVVEFKYRLASIQGRKAVYEYIKTQQQENATSSDDK